MSDVACDPRVTGLMSQEECASSFEVRASNFMVVKSAPGNEKTPVVKGTMHKLHKVRSTLSSCQDHEQTVAESHKHPPTTHCY